jgi:Flp pilus assembly protein TadD
MGQYKEAEQSVRKALELDPDKVEGYPILAGILIAQKKNAEAELVMQKAVKLAPDNIQTRIAYGSILGQLNKRVEAEAEYREVLRLDPNNARALNNLGYSMVERNVKLDEALAIIQKAVDAAPDNSSFLDSLGWAYFKLGRFEEAERYINRALEGSYKSAAIYEHLGDVYVKQGKRELAVEAWKKALELSKIPDSTDRLKAKLSDEPEKKKQ